MRSWFVCLFLLVGLSSLTVNGAAKGKHIPLPPQVLTAKTVYIDNQSGFARLGDRAYEQLQKSGRVQVVQDRKQADLIFLLSELEYNQGYVTSGSTTTTKVDKSGNIKTSSSPTYSTPVSTHYIYLTVIDPKTGDNLWSDSKQQWDYRDTGFDSAAKSLIAGLEKRIKEEQTSRDMKK